MRYECINYSCTYESPLPNGRLVVQLDDKAKIRPLWRHYFQNTQGLIFVVDNNDRDHVVEARDELHKLWNKEDNLPKHVHSSGLSRRIELVIVPPLLRTMQTAVGVFGGEAYVGGIDVPPLMKENIVDSSRPAISSLNSPPFVAVELCREHLGVHWCDKRRSISEYTPLFPAIDFSQIEIDADTLWKLDVREANEDLAERGLRFLNWLWTREETEIAVVTHSGFLIHTLAAFGEDCHPSVKSEICRPFNNCELRSVVIVDRSMIASSSSKTDYPGKTPCGPDAPSDSADEKH